MEKISIDKSTIQFEPIIGQHYHLYERKNDTLVLSLISPAEWGERFPFKSWRASVELLPDQTWKVVSYPEDSREKNTKA
jgi:hypothetical protein